MARGQSNGAAMPMMLRRRLTPIGQASISAAYQAGADAAVHCVFTSRHGEFARSLRLLETLAAHQPLSPADFSLCVHNALVGLLSIATRAHAGHTAIAAGPDSLAAGLLEAAALLTRQPSTSVLLVYFDDDLPVPFDALQPEPRVGPVALALLLGAPRPDAANIRFAATPQPPNPSAGTAAPALALLRFLAEDLAVVSASGSRLMLEFGRGA